MGNYAQALDHNARTKKMAGKTPQLHSIEIEKAENGGHVVTHRMESGDGPYHAPSVHVFRADEGKKMVAHIAKHMEVKLGPPSGQSTNEDHGQTESDGEGSANPAAE